MEPQNTFNQNATANPGGNKFRFNYFNAVTPAKGRRYAVLCILGGIVLLAIGVFSIFQARIPQGYVKAVATVVTADNAEATATLKFTIIGGQTITYADNDTGGSSKSGGYTVGQTTPVFYNPAAPENSPVFGQDSITNYLTGIAFILVALALWILAGYFIKRFINRPKDGINSAASSGF